MSIINCLNHKCNNFGDRQGCLEEPNERYTMCFDDIGEPPIYWCSFCGPDAAAMNEVITNAFETRGPSFAKEFEEKINEAEQENLKKAN